MNEMNEIDYTTARAATMLAKMNRDTRAKTEELARRLGLNPEYVEHIQYVTDPHDLAAPEVRVFMRSFTLTLEPEFDIDDDRHILPDVARDMACTSHRACHCDRDVVTDVWHTCAACAVRIGGDE